ncbi:uncharacterized protein AB675_9513 [Cyphellophora attinorum]|uniref:SPRY domain-containing protein n=1 Tax=Cyphellophora attinorum TaxID=1664694 RepID=A0A0N1P1T7_9EURO|nr:uncharacterized protein AB675_9513 [Phialophora attinorum]KPI42623.1 hypothetical protein AB675_9513 [Phialophora attinorum]
MGFFKSLKGKVDVGTSDQQYENPQYTSGTHDELSAANDKRRMFGGSSRSNQPQAQSSAPPCSPPSGPPPSSTGKGEYQPPSNPPPTSNPQPYHDWTSVPDTSLLPPPPSFPSEFSPTNNASDEAADAAYQWCAQFPPYSPVAPSDSLITASNNQQLILERPEPFARSASLTQPRPQVFHIRTKPHHRDVVSLSNLPLYFAAAHHPLHTERPKTIYFELLIIKLADANSAFGIGFAGKPYPPWRLPGWNRASIGVHSDDGRRYVNDSGGGVEMLQQPLVAGETFGVGMRFSTEAKTDVTVKTRCFVTRNGSEVGGWDVDEERDKDVGGGEGIAGLEGEGDLYVAVGLFGGVEGEVRLSPRDWSYVPEGI